MSRQLTYRWTRTLVCMVAVSAVVILGSVSLLHGRAAHAVSLPTTRPAALAQVTGSGPYASSRAEALRSLVNDRQNFPLPVARAEVKHMLLGELRRASADWRDGSGMSVPSATTAGNRPIWVVAASGDFVPDVPGLPGGAPVTHENWAVLVISAEPDAGLPPIAVLQAERQGAWPSYFDALFDDGTP